MAIEAVIWDFGGVITSSPFEAFNRFEAERDLPADTIRSINATNPDTNAWALLERSEVSAVEFDDLFAAEAAERGHEIRGSEVLALLSGDVRPEMVAALKVCKAAAKIGCITNNVSTKKEDEGAHLFGAGMARSPEKAAEITEIMGLFDHVIESSKAGVRKPDPLIYQMMLEALEADPARCVYLDDLGINLKPARAMGMTTIKVLNAEQALSELKAATGFTF